MNITFEWVDFNYPDDPIVVSTTLDSFNSFLFETDEELFTDAVFSIMNENTTLGMIYSALAESDAFVLVPETLEIAPVGARMEFIKNPDEEFAVDKDKLFFTITE